MPDRSQRRRAGIDELYALPLDEFTAARDELARRLKREDQADVAAEVKRLRKPSVVAWALNQVRRNDPELTDQLIAAGGRLREAQERLLAGEGREPLQSATADERRLVVELARHAERELVAAGRPVSGAVQEKLRATLHAVASDPEAREGLAAGRLVHEHEATGLGPAEPRAPSAGAGQRRREPSSATRERKAKRLEERVERARSRQHGLDEESADAVRRLREARREATRAAAELERAEADEERARGRAEKAAEAVTELEYELRELSAGRGG